MKGDHVGKFHGVTFTLPRGWALEVPHSSGPPSDQMACAGPQEPTKSAPSWIGCAGIWIEPWTTNPSQTADQGLVQIGAVWYPRTGVLPCPYLGSGPANSVLTPGTLTANHQKRLGALDSQWHRWSATCNTDAPPAPVTHRFSPQVWWLPAQGIAFVDAIGHKQTVAILTSVRAEK